MLPFLRTSLKHCQIQHRYHQTFCSPCLKIYNKSDEVITGDDDKFCHIIENASLNNTIIFLCKSLRNACHRAVAMETLLTFAVGFVICCHTLGVRNMASGPAISEWEKIRKLFFYNYLTSTFALDTFLSQGSSQRSLPGST